jgi:transcriptional regulator with XRE-family HTH domain
MEINKLRQLRIELGLTLDELAAKSGINRDTLSRAENGRKLQPLTLGKLAKALGVPLTDLADFQATSRVREKKVNRQEIAA